MKVLLQMPIRNRSKKDIKASIKLVKNLCKQYYSTKYIKIYAIIPEEMPKTLYVQKLYLEKVEKIDILFTLYDGVVHRDYRDVLIAHAEELHKKTVSVSRATICPDLYPPIILPEDC